MDSLGSQMKLHESKAITRFNVEEALFVRLDGKNFSKWTKDLARPFDGRFSDIMVELTMSLSQEFNVDISYTQSDEISLCWKARQHPSEHPYGGKSNKLVSLTAAYASVKFNKLVSEVFPGKATAYFDSRSFAVPEEEMKDVDKLLGKLEEDDDVMNVFHNMTDNREASEE